MRLTDRKRDAIIDGLDVAGRGNLRVTALLDEARLRQLEVAALLASLHALAKEIEPLGEQEPQA